MKQKIQKYALSGCLSLLLSACTAWFDGALPQDQNLEDIQFSTESGIETVLNGIYRTMANQSLYGEKLSTKDVELLAHYYYYDSNTSSTTTAQAYEFHKVLSTYDYSTKVGRDAFQPIWNASYKLIYRINRFIDKVKDTQVLAPERMQLYLGEAYGLRAFLHFDMFRLFSNVEGTQLIPYNATAEVVPHTPVENVAEFKKLLLNDISKADSLLRNDPIKEQSALLNILGNEDIGLTDVSSRFYSYSRNYRLNCYANSALEARVRLFFGETEQAANIAKGLLNDIVGANANAGRPFYWADKSNVITLDGKLNYIFLSEILFGVYSMDCYTWWNDMTGGSTAGHVFSVLDANLRSNIYRNDVGLDGDYQLWEDVRAKQWHSSKETAPTLVSGKYSDYSTTTFKDYMQPLIRISELYLMVVEDMIDKDQVSDAVECLNDFKFNRGWQYSTLPDPTTISKEKAYDILETEFYKEFYGEGQAFFFMKRRARTEIINPQAAGMLPIGKDSYTVPLPESETNV